KARSIEDPRCGSGDPPAKLRLAWREGIAETRYQRETPRHADQRGDGNPVDRGLYRAGQEEIGPNLAQFPHEAEGEAGIGPRRDHPAAGRQRMERDSLGREPRPRRLIRRTEHPDIMAGVAGRLQKRTPEADDRPRFSLDDRNPAHGDSIMPAPSGRKPIRVMA